ncbi:hypothetical protein [Catellatospora tritici]|uniref:hypothetical protein n=1 Tax=Catellatospora tritici TaxID=2851566 RepID=UPI001C2D98E2|nr:hypothetical protein [Catellatospora tritici]MBV1856670.1 hypothetical protein [Catellatospora tritici]
MVLGASVSLTAAAPAEAVSGIVVTIDWSDLTGSESAKTANAFCPSGKVILGGGADIVGGGNEVRLTAMVPQGGWHSYYASAMEDGDYDADWTLYSWAICGNPVPGWELVSAYDAGEPGDDIVHTLVICPEGKRVMGTGGAAVGGYQFKLAYISPGPAPEPWDVWVGVTPDENVSGPFGAYAYAICTNPMGQQRVSVDSISSSVNKGVSVECPAGTKVHGTGALIGGLSGASERQVHLDRIGLLGPGALGGVDVAAHEDQTGYRPDWYVRVYAICAP